MSKLHCGGDDCGIGDVYSNERCDCGCDRCELPRFGPEEVEIDGSHCGSGDCYGSNDSCGCSCNSCRVERHSG